MLRNLRTRRRPRYGAHVCAVIAALLLLLSVSLLHSRLGFDRHHSHSYLHHHNDVVYDPLLDDVDLEDRILTTGSDDRIDEHDDVVQEESEPNEEEILRTAESGEDGHQPGVSEYFFDHINSVVRRAFDKRSIDQWEDYVSFAVNSGLRLGLEDPSKAAFGSDDIPVDEGIRRKMNEVKGVEDLLLLKMGSKNSPLREGWGEWFDKKGDFLRRDRMFKSNLELLNPMNNPLLQNPDVAGSTGLTRGDKLLQKGLMNEFKKVPFLVKKPLAIVESTHELKLRLKSESELVEDRVEDVITKFGGNGNLKDKGTESIDEGRIEMKRAERRTLKGNATDGSYDKGNFDDNEALNVTTAANSSLKSDRSKELEQKNGGNIVKSVDSSVGELGQISVSKHVEATARMKTEVSGQIYADGRTWGYFPGLNPRLSFSNFMDAFFRKGKCFMTIFMVWNSPPWMFSVRHQRGIESLLLHHRDACVVVFSETIELNFFDGLVKDGFKVAVVMPNLDELLKDTPTHVFASVWFEWKKTKFYSTHYSELVRLAALYKYGGIYLDSDIVVLKPLTSLNNTVGLEDVHAGNPLNGAVMAFKKHSPFIKECLTEFYSTYDDTRLRWNGADLLTRVAKSFLGTENPTDKQVELKLQPYFVFFPISRENITRFFSAPTTETGRAKCDLLFKKILNESFTIHFWNSMTSALIPEPESLVAMLLDHHCIHCSDVL